MGKVFSEPLSAFCCLINDRAEGTEFSVTGLAADKEHRIQVSFKTQMIALSVF